MKMCLRCLTSGIFLPPPASTNKADSSNKLFLWKPEVACCLPLILCLRPPKQIHTSIPSASPPLTVAMLDIVRPPCLCTVSGDTVGRPHAWNLGVILSLQLFGIGCLFTESLSGIKRKCNSGMKIVLLLKGCYVPCTNPTQISACSLLSQFHGAAFVRMTRLYIFFAFRLSILFIRHFIC